MFEDEKELELDELSLSLKRTYDSIRSPVDLGVVVSHKDEVCSIPSFRTGFNGQLFALCRVAALIVLTGILTVYMSGWFSLENVQDDQLVVFKETAPVNTRPVHVARR